jgi:hypothetical protein
MATMPAPIILTSSSIIPLQAIPSQQLLTTLAGLTVQLNIYQLRYGLFMDVIVEGTLEIGGVICQNLNRIIRNSYLNAETGFVGDFMFNDTQGSSDPVYTGLGTQYQLLYVSEADLATLGIPDQ